MKFSYTKNIDTNITLRLHNQFLTVGFERNAARLQLDDKVV
jgi:hypothetical protein